MLSLLMHIHLIVAVIMSVVMYAGLRKHFKRMFWSDILLIAGVSLSWEWWVVRFSYDLLSRGRK